MHSHIQFRPPADADVSQRLMGAFMRIHRQHWHRHIEGGLRPHEFGILNAIRRLTDCDGKGPRASDLSSRMHVTPPTITQQVAELERRGMVERVRDVEDRRSVRIILKDDGIAVLERNREEILALFKIVAESLGPERSESLAALLTEAADCMESVK